PLSFARSVGMMTSSGSTPSASRRRARIAFRLADPSHSSSTSSRLLPTAVSQTEAAQVQHHFGDAAREKDAHGRVWPVRQHFDEARHAAVHTNPFVNRRRL